MSNHNFQQRFPNTIALLEKARGDVFPAYSVGIAHGGEATFAFSGCGQDSLFDLASVTKVLCTTTLYAIAEEKQRLSIDVPVRQFFPAFQDGRVTLSHLLNHSSGLPAWLPLHEAFHEPIGRGAFAPRTTPDLARIEYEKRIVKAHRPDDFEKNCIYSDLGFMLLGWALEKATGVQLDALFQEWVVGPFTLESLQFLPTTPDVVPTEDCPWRGHVLRGEVHDDNCYVLGGVSGHAGLFGNVRDVIKLAGLWLKGWQLGGQARAANAIIHLLSPETAHRFWTRTHIASSSYALGWDGVSPSGSSTGHFFSRASRGHLGFTGTSVWIDPEKNLIVSLLTNRVHPTRENQKIKAFRPIFHDTLLTELGVKT